MDKRLSASGGQNLPDQNQGFWTLLGHYRLVFHVLFLLANPGSAPAQALKISSIFTYIVELRKVKTVTMLHYVVVKINKVIDICLTRQFFLENC